MKPLVLLCNALFILGAILVAAYSVGYLAAMDDVYRTCIDDAAATPEGARSIEPWCRKWTPEQFGNGRLARKWKP